MDSLPALLERKKRGEAHNNLLQAMFSMICDRDVPTYYEMEEVGFWLVGWLVGWLVHEDSPDQLLG